MVMKILNIINKGKEHGQGPEEKNGKAPKKRKRESPLFGGGTAMGGDRKGELRNGKQKHEMFFVSFSISDLRKFR